MIANGIRKTTGGSWRRRSLSVIHGTSAFRHLRKLAPSSLTTLVYHRVADPDSGDFFGFRGNISATVEAFAEQIRYLDDNFDVVSLDDVLGWVDGRNKLPENAVLLTFDDGYRDNLVNAAPILKARGLRATLFVSTGFVDDRQVFFWDWVCDAFRKSVMHSAELPLLGYAEFDSPSTADQVAALWIRAAKLIPEDRKITEIAALADALDVAPPATPPRGTQLDWQDIRQLADDCFDFGCHTVNHPILTRIGIEAAETEIVDSKRALERALSRPIRSFAYPNGEFGAEHEALLERLRFDAAFAGSGGLTFSPEAGKRRFALRRSCIGLKDSPPIFAAKAAGLGRIAAVLG